MANEKRLIDANAVRHKIDAFAASVVYRGNAEMFNGKDSCNPHEYTRGYERGIMDAQKIVCGQPTVDAVEVVHGHWEYGKWEQGHWVKGNERCRCSVCHRDFAVDNSNIWHGCPQCLAKMDGDGNG